MSTPPFEVKLSDARIEFALGSRLSAYRGAVDGMPLELLKLSDIRDREAGGGTGPTTCELRAFIETPFTNTTFTDFANWETWNEDEALWWTELGYSNAPLPFTGTVGNPTVDPGQTEWSIFGSNDQLVIQNTTVPSNEFVVQYWFSQDQRYYPGTTLTFNATGRASGLGGYMEWGFLAVMRTTDGVRFFDYANQYDGTSGADSYTTSDWTFTVPEDFNGYWVDYYVPFFGVYGPYVADLFFFDQFEVKDVIRDETCPVIIPDDFDEFEPYVKWAVSAETGFLTSQYGNDYVAPTRGDLTGAGSLTPFQTDPIDREDEVWTFPDRLITDQYAKFGTHSMQFNSVRRYDDPTYNPSGIENSDFLKAYTTMDWNGMDRPGYTLNGYAPAGSDNYNKLHYAPVVGYSDFTLEVWCRADYQLQRYNQVSSYQGGGQNGDTYIEYKVPGRAALFGIGNWYLNHGEFTDFNSPYPSNIGAVFGALLFNVDGVLYWSKGEYDTNTRNTIGRRVADWRPRVDCPNSPNIRDGEWHFVSVTRDAGTIYIHVDGVLEGQGSDGRYYTGRKENFNSSFDSPYTACTVGHTPGALGYDGLWGDSRTPLEQPGTTILSAGLYPGGSAEDCCPWQGQLDDFRYTCGKARYGEDDYAVPTSSITSGYRQFVNPFSY